MVTFKIDEKHSVGNFVLDEQHQHFVSLIESLSDSHEGALQSVIDELFEYIRYHFEDEERMLRDVDYPLLEEHIVQHGRFVKFVILMTDKLQQKTLQVDEVKTLLIEWFVNHICVEDMKFKEYIQNY